MKRFFLILTTFIAAYANAQTYQIGDLIEFPDKTFGVVFYLNQQTGDGLACSMDEIETPWQTARDAEDCVNIYKLLDKGSYGEFCIPGAGLEQTRFILEQLGMTNAPAAAWCAMHGEGWYLPSAAELYQMLFVANASGGDSGPLSSAIKRNGGQAIEYKYYWSSCEEDAEHAFNLCTIPKKKKRSENKNEDQGVRAVRQFKL
jgi:hypothetical protein